MRSTLVALLVGGLLLMGPAARANPSNDDFANAAEITSLPHTAEGSNEEATLQSGEPRPSCGGSGATLWYRYTPPSDVTIFADTFESDFDTVLAVYKGTSFDDLIEIACSDQAGGDQSYVEVETVGGEALYLQAGGWDRTGDLLGLIYDRDYARGHLVLHVSDGSGGGGGGAPANDNRANATVIAGLPFVEAIDLAGATVEPDEFEPYCEWSPTNSVWYTYTPAESRSILIDLSLENEESFSFFVAVYRDGGDFHQIACLGGYSSLVYLDAGDTYLLQVGANTNYSENLRATLSLSLPPQVDFAVTKLEVRNAPLRTDWADVPSGFARKVDVEIKLLSSSVPGPAPYYLDVLACPKTALYCEYIEFTYDELEPGGTFTGTFDWNGLGDAGDFRIHAFVDPENAEDIDGRNNSKSVDHYVLVGGTGVGVGVPCYYVTCP